MQEFMIYEFSGFICKYEPARGGKANMRKRFVKRLSAITAAMLMWNILPMDTFAQVATPSEIESPAETEAPVKAVEEPTFAPGSVYAEAEGTKKPEPAPVEVEETEPTPVPEPAIMAFDTSTLPEKIVVPYGTEEDGLDLPKALTAVFDDGTTMQVAVSWACASDGLGDTAYNPNHINPAEALFTFRAELADDVSCTAEPPEMNVIFEATSMLVSADAESVLYRAASNFTVTIPSAASVNDGSMTITCGELNGGTVTVQVESTNGWQLKSDDASIGYQLMTGGTAVQSGGTVACFDEAGSTELTLKLTDPTAVYPAGTYKDTLTFVISTD